MTQRIVLAQRDPVARAALSGLLREGGYDVEATDAWQDARDRCRRTPPDLLVLASDLRDPGVEQALLQARAEPLLSKSWLALLGGASDTSGTADHLIDGFLISEWPSHRLRSQIATLLAHKARCDAPTIDRGQMTRIFQRAPSAMLIVSMADNTILLANPAAAELFGTGPQSLVGKPFGHVDEVVRAAHEPVEVELERGRRAAVVASMRASPIDRPAGPAWLITLHDVTAALEARSRLAEGEQRYRSLFDQNPDAVYSVRPDGSFTSANAAFHQLTGYTGDEVALLGCATVVAPEWADAALQQFRRAMAGEAVRYETVGVRKDGGRFDADVKNLPIFVEGSIVGVYGIIKDITERKSLIRALQASERQLSLIFAQAATGVAIATLAGRFVEANPAFCHMLGYTLAELQSLDMQSLTHHDDRARNAGELARAMTGNPGHFVTEKRYMHRNGQVVWVRVSVTVVHEERRPRHLVGIFEDITARRNAEDALRDSQALESMAGRVAQIGGWSLDLATSTLRQSGEVKRIHGNKSGATPDVDRALSCYSPEHQPAIREAVQRCIAQGMPFDIEAQIVLADGSRRWVRAIGEAERDSAGQIARVQGAFQQIDARKQAELALSESNQRLRMTLESIGDAFFTIDRDWRFGYVNHRAEAMVGRSRERLIGRNLWEEFPELAGSPFAALYERVMAERVAGSLEDFHPAPISSWVEVNAHPSPDGLSVYVRDVSVRRAAGERLRLLEKSIERLEDIVLITAADPLDEPGPQIVYANAAFERHTGYRCEEVIGRSPRFLQGPLTDRAALDRIRDALAHQRPVREELINYTKAGESFWLELDIAPVADESGRVTHYIAVERDITERKNTDLRLRHKLFRLALLQKITRAIGAHQDLTSIFSVLCDSIERDMPAALCAVALYDDASDDLSIGAVGRGSRPSAAAAGLDIGDRLDVERNGLRRALDGELVHERKLSGNDAPLPRQLFSVGLESVVIAPLRFESRIFGALITARVDPLGFASGDCEFLQQLGEHVALAAHEAHLYASLQTAYDDLKVSQVAAIEQERLRAVAQMAGGIAHDINNAISPITLYTDSLLESERGLGPRARNQLETIRLAIGDVADSVTRLRSFARADDRIRLVPVSLNELVEQVVQLTRARWRDLPTKNGFSIELVKQLDGSLPLVAAAEGELREALTNLVLNALDAMPAGGTLTLRTLVTREPGPAPAMVCCEVADSGVGMDESTRLRCIEPYFTTKGERGTGLGLAMVSLTMRRHGGELQIDSTPGEGTRTRLLFAPLPPTETAAGEESALATERAPLRLLLIDDDPVMLRSLADILDEEGHQVHAEPGGRSGVEAFAAALQQLRPFHAVITDLGMPQMDGRQVAEAVKAASPSTPVLMLTGWGRRMQDADETPEHVDELLSKPPRLADIRAALARCTATEQRPKDPD